MQITIVMESLNAKVGYKMDGEIVANFGLETSNESGEKRVQWCTANHQVVANALFQEHPRRICIEKPRRINEKLNRLFINKRLGNAVLRCKTYQSSDHLPVICKLKVELWKLKSVEAASNYNTTDF